MKPLIVLLSAFVLSLLITKIVKGDIDSVLSGKIAMSAMLLFTAVGHFAYVKGMSMMLPNFIPCKTEWVYLTGVMEIVMAIGLLIPGFAHGAAWSLIVFLIVVLPANIYAAIKHVDYQKGSFYGHGLDYLWFRIPLQILFIAWTYLFVIKSAFTR